MLESTFVLDPLLLKYFLPWEFPTTVSPTLKLSDLLSTTVATTPPSRGSFILKALYKIWRHSFGHVGIY
jgi:hypothetical protein